MSIGVFKMKFDFLREVIYEDTFEVDDTVEGTINKLRQQSGFCRERDARKNHLRFDCSKDGKIKVGNMLGAYKNNTLLRIKNFYGKRRYIMRGEVLQENGTTKVKTYYCRRKYQLLLRFTLYAFEFVITPIIFALLLFWIFFPEITRNEFTVGVFVIMCAYILLVNVFILSFLLKYRKSEEQNKELDYKIMKNEILKRVEAIKRWNE